MSRVLIAGSGYVGRRTADTMAARSHDVIALSRSGGRDTERVRHHVADLTDPASLERLPEADTLVFTAAPDSGSDETYAAIYVRGLENLIAAATRGGHAPSRLLLVSSTGVYGQSAGEHVNEDSETSPRRFSGRRLLESEAVARSCGIESVVVRLAGIYGPGRTRLVERVAAGEAKLTGDLAYTNRIHRDDCAGLLAHLAEHPAPEPVYIGVDDDAAPMDEVTGFIAERLGVDLAQPENRAGVASGKRCSNARMRAAGYKPVYASFRDGYPEVVDGYLAATRR